MYIVYKYQIYRPIDKNRQDGLETEVCKMAVGAARKWWDRCRVQAKYTFRECVLRVYGRYRVGNKGCRGKRFRPRSQYATRRTVARDRRDGRDGRAYPPLKDRV